MKAVLRGAPPPEAPWVEDGPLRHRSYDSEADYVKHQRSKLDTRQEWVSEVDQMVERVIADRLPDVSGRSVLCLAARLGGEVRAFRSAGAFAIGIDLNPGDSNRWVLPGDFHALDFSDDSVDVVFTNSLDHALDVTKVAAEIARVVKPQGLVILEIGKGKSEGGDFGRWEATSWERLEDVVAVFAGCGFVADDHRVDFDEPWAGQQVRLRLTA